MSNSTNVETNVVQMRFDNKRFEKNVSQTMNSLDKLKKELKFDDSAKSFKALEENAKKVDFSPLSKGIEKVQASFSFLDTFSATVYHRLSNRLIDIGKKITTSVSTEGIRSGFNEYELKMNSFKTIKASAGKDFTDSQINEYLEELNRYADKTIYSFSDMTNNIGKFTNAGVKLNVAVKAIQGISNEAAISGANAQEASRAMYNFSQALSSGYVKLIDWKSIELANMATEEFKNELIKTAVSVGKLTKAQNGMYKTQKGKLLNSTQGFNDALQDQWMTTEVLTKTLEKYADETTDIGKKAFDAAQKVNTFTKLIDTLKEAIQSGWSQTWELILGNLEEASKLWTAVSDKIGGVIDAFFKEKKAVLENWKAHHGRERTLAALTKIMHNLGDVLRAVGSAWRSVFPKATVNSMMRFTEGLENIAKKTVMTRSRLEPFIDTMKGLISLLAILREGFVAFRRTFSSLFGRIFKDALHSIFGVSGSLGQMLVQIKNGIIQNKTFYKVFEQIANTLEKVYEKIKKVISVIWSFIKIVGNAVNQNGGFNSFYKWISSMGTAIRNLDFKSVLNGIIKAIKMFGKIIDKVLSDTFDFYTPFKEKIIALKTKIQNSKLVSGVVDIFKSMVSGIQKVFNSFRNIKTDGVDEFTDKTKKKFSFFDTLVSFFKKIFNALISVAKAIWKIAKPVVKFVGKVVKSVFDELLGIIRRSDLGDVGLFMAGGGFGALFSSIGGFFKKLSGIGNPGKSVSKMLNAFGEAVSNLASLIKAKTLKEIATSIMILAGALLILALLPQDKLSSSMVIIAALFATITKAVKSLTGSYSGTSMMSSLGITSVILAIASAMMILSASLAVLSLINYENATKALAMMSIILTMIVVSVDRISKVAAKGKTSAITLVSISILIATLASALTLLTIPIIAFSIIIAKQKNGAGNLLKASGILVGVLGAISAIVIVLTKMVSKMRIADVAKVAGVLYIFGGVFKKLAMSIALLMGTLAVVAMLITRNQISIDGLETAGSMFVGILAVLSGVIIAFSEISKRIQTGDLVKIASLVGVVSVMVSILSGIFIAISFISSERIENGTIGLGAITTALVTIMSSFAIIAKLNAFKNVGFTDIMKMMLMTSAVIVPFTLAITALLIGMSTFVKTLSKYSIDENIIKAALLMVAGMIGAVTTTMVVLANMSKNISIKDSLKLSLLVTVITALLLTISLIVTALSTLNAERIESGTKGLMAVSASLVLIFTALRIIIGTAEKNKVGLVNGIKSLLLITIALNAIVGTLGALVYLAKQDSFDSALAALLKIGAAITALAYVTGRSKALAKGLKILSTTIAALSVAAAAFGVFVAAIVKAFTLLKDLTENDIMRIEKNVKQLGTVFKNTFNDLAKIVGTAIAFVIKTILNTIWTTIATSGKEILDGLLLLFDSVIAQAPQLIDKAFELLVALLTAIERSLAPVVETALKVAISFINAFANGIRDHSDEILNAISNLIDAAASLIAKAVTRVLGLKEWESGYLALKGIVKNFGALILTIFAINKLRSRANAATSILSVFITKVKGFVSTLKTNGFGSAWNEMLGIDKLNTAWKQAGAELSNGKMILSRGFTLLKGAITGAGIGLALGTLVKGFIDAKAEAIDVTSGMAGDIDLIYKDLAEKTKKTFEDLNKKRKDYYTKYSDKTEVYTEVNALKRTLETMIDTDGKVLAGHETEVKNIVEAINDKIGERLTLENGILQSLDNQGKAQKYSSDMLDKIIQKERMKADLEVAAEENKENIKLKKDLSQELQGWTTDQVKKDQETAQQFIDALNSGDIRNITNDKTFRELAEKYNFDYSGLTKDSDQKTAATRLKAAMDLSEKSIETRRKDIINKISEVNGRMELYQKAQEAALKENTDAYNKYMAMLETGVSPGANTATQKQQAMTQARSISNMLENFEEGSYTKDDVEKAIVSFNELVKELSDKGEKLGDITNLSFGKSSMSYDEFIKEAGEKFAKLPETIKYAAEDTSKEVEKIGKEGIGIPLGDGIFKGTSDKILGEGKTEAAKGVSALKGDWRYAAGVHSPSTVMHDEVGIPLGEGVLTGISDAIASADSNSNIQNLISKLQSSIFPAIAGLSGNSIPFTGVTPVNFGLDQNGSGLFGAALPVNGALPYDTHLANITAILQMHSENMMNQTNTIIAEIGNLRNDVVALGAHIDDMELSLDGDALVGGLTPRLNNALYIYSRRVERGL